jgi:broad specificity phosphatase PhoE
VTIFHLVRHGAHVRQGMELAGRTPGLGLSDLGLRQLGFLRRQLAGRRLSAVRSGPLERAVATARCFGLPVEVSAALDEVDFGQWTGRHPAELSDDPRWRHWNTHRSTGRIPGGETMVAVEERAVGLIGELATGGHGGEIVLVTHGDVIRAVLLHFLGMNLDHWARLSVDPGSLSTLQVANCGACLTRLNHVDQPPPDGRDADAA